MPPCKGGDTGPDLKWKLLAAYSILMSCIFYADCQKQIVEWQEGSKKKKNLINLLNNVGFVSLCFTSMIIKRMLT